MRAEGPSRYRGTGARGSDRLHREREFHDDRYTDEVRAAAKKYYSVTGSSLGALTAALDRVGPGTRVLEYGCGPGSLVLGAAESGARLTGIDISSVAIARAGEAASALGSEVLDFVEMNAEDLQFEDQSFDLVVGNGILHHLDLEAAFEQLRRVLSSTGRAVFREPLGHNPAINLYRRLTPAMRTDDEHPLKMDDFDLARRFFERVDVQYFQMTSVLAVPFRQFRGFRRLVGLLDRIDALLFDKVPVTRRLAWTSVITLSFPRRTPS